MSDTLHDVAAVLEKRAICVNVDGSEWPARSVQAALEAANAYPREWTYTGEEEFGPAGIDHIRYEQRWVKYGGWEATSDE